MFCFVVCVRARARVCKYIQVNALFQKQKSLSLSVLTKAQIHHQVQSRSDARHAFTLFTPESTDTRARSTKVSFCTMWRGRHVGFRKCCVGWVGADAVAKFIIESGGSCIKSMDLSVNQCGLRGTVRLKNVSQPADVMCMYMCVCVYVGEGYVCGYLCV